MRMGARFTGPGWARWGPMAPIATRQESNKSDKWCQFTKTLPTPTPSPPPPLTAAYQIAPTTAEAENTPPPSLTYPILPSPLRRTEQPLLSTCVFTHQRFPSGFGSMWLYFLESRMVQWKWGSAGREANGGEGLGGGGASKSQGIKPAHGLLEAARGCDDSMAIWCKTGVGQGQKGVGPERKKQTMLQTGRRAGAHRSAVCRLFVSSLANRGPSVDHLQRQCEDEDAPSGDMEMCTKLRKFSMFAWCG